MILQALYDYYQRKKDDSDSNIAPFGMERKEIPFIIVIDEEGNFLRLEERNEGNGKDKLSHRFLVLRSKTRSGCNSWANACVFWDNYGYLLGIAKASAKKKESDMPKAIEYARKQNITFRKTVSQYCQQFPENKQFRAVKIFYQKEQNMELLKNDPLWETITKKDGTCLSFRLVKEDKLVAEHEDLIPKPLIKEGEKEGICLITGERAPICILHTRQMIPGGGSNSTIVAFQKNSGFDSYGKEQGLNAPISIEAESAYSTALKELLDKNSHNKFKMGEITFLFWAQRKCKFEKDFSLFFNSTSKDDPDRNIQAIRALMQSPYKGKVSDQEETKFYLLGLSPNVTRISVRSWREGTVKDFANKIRLHFEDLRITKGTKEEREYFSLFHLLTQIAFQYKIDKLPPNMVSDVLNSVLNGTPYPTTLQLHCINRIRVDHSISYIRAAILKAYLNRKIRFNNNLNKPITMALDKENTNQAYLCGRLFATLEKIQEEAAPGLNASIKDQYYSSASATPVAVFPRLLALKNHHTPKLNPGRAVNMERLIGEIMSSMEANGFPCHLSLDDQSRFAIGYYHQRNDFFSSKENNNESKL
ncbi:MAG: type I-C CRISPR-associated protein Cas8c/Csd1 [Bacteroidaceae bacterium]